MTEDELGFTPEELETLQIALLDYQHKWAGDPDSPDHAFLRVLYAKLGRQVAKEYRPLRYAPIVWEFDTPTKYLPNAPQTLTDEGDTIAVWINEGDLVWLRLRNMAAKH